MAVSTDYLKMIEEQDKQRKAESLNSVYGANTKQVTTYDPQGNYTPGYLLNSKTYLDPQGTQRLPVGYTSIVNDKAYLMTDTGGQYLYDMKNIPSQARSIATPTNSAESYLSRMYDAQTEANKSALTSAYQQNMNALQAQRERIPQQYETARNQVAAQSEVERQKWNEYAAASGLNQGASGQAQLSFSNLLQSNLADTNRAQADALAQLDLQVAQVQTQYKNDVAKAIADGDFAKAQSLYNNFQVERDRLIQQQQYLSNLSYNYATLDNTRQNQEYNRQSEEFERNYSIALNAATSSGDYSGMTAYGWTPEQINSARQEWSRQRTPTGGSGGGGGGGQGKPTLTAAQAMEAYLQGITTPEVLATLGYYYGTQDPYGLLVAQPDTPTANPGGASIADQVTNQVDTRSGGNDFVRVAGFGRLTWQELYNAVERGEIEEVYNQQTGKYTYRKASKTSGSALRGGGETNNLSVR